MWELYDVTLLVIVSFKFYVMNFVEIVIDFYLHITSHVFKAFASCTHYKVLFAKLITLYCVWSCCGHSRLHVPGFWCKMSLMFEFWRQIGCKTCFWEIWVEFKCFWKTFNLILMHFIHEILCSEELLHWIALFSKIWFFHASFMFRIHMYCIDFLYPSCSFAIISFIVFTHNMHTIC